MSIHENSPTKVQLTHLETKKVRLRIESCQIESANAARRRLQPPTSDEEMGGTSDIDCYLCHDSHYLVECPYLKEAGEFVRALEAQQKSKKYRKRKPIGTSARKGKGEYTRKSQGLVSTNFDEPFDDESSSNDESTDDSEPETADISTQNRPTPRRRPSAWPIDTGASSHMTDQVNLFRGPLTKLKKRRPIQVGGET
ncbi:hypothetical protein K3495_g6983 [Podosphaera aphanis]|nr:hypothetical protein K3495_g6983 [Podosphaera aphanis]